MKKATVFFFCALFLFSCRSQTRDIILISDLQEAESLHLLEFAGILESRNGRGSANLPAWLTAYISGGIAEVERLEIYGGRYCFIARNEGSNFDVLSKWIANYSAVRDFPRLAAARIEQRMVSAASLNPDDEYGLFYERLAKRAFDTEFSGARLEDTYWIRLDRPSNNYEFFVFITIDKTTMQTTINNMISDVYSSVTLTRHQNSSVNRLRQNFFEGF